MLHFILGKIGQYGLVLLIALTLNFLLPRLMPGNPIELLAGEGVNQLTAAERNAVLARAGLNDPLPQQYLSYLGSILRADFGYSYRSNREITAILAERIPWTLLLTGTSLVLATVIGVFLGAVAAWRRGSRGDLAMLGIFVFLESLPSFWVGMVLIALFGVQWPIFPTFGGSTAWLPLTGWAYVGDIVSHLVLPLTTLTIVTVSGVFLVARSSMLLVLGEEFIVAARARGLRERRVLFRHALRNALLPIATVFTLNLAFAFGGATVVETVFSYPGVGRLIFEAVLNRDYPLLQAAFLMITVLVVLANIVSDLLYPLLDPRVRRPEAGGRGRAR